MTADYSAAYTSTAQVYVVAPIYMPVFHFDPDKNLD